jgi:hypothetical protein
MMVYQLKTRIDPEDTINIQTYSKREEAEKALEYWTSVENEVKAMFQSMTEAELDAFFDSDKHRLIPKIYDTYSCTAWIQEVEVLDSFDSEPLKFDISILKTL